MPDKPRPLSLEDIDSMEEVLADVRLAKSQVFSIRLNDKELKLLAREAHALHMKVGAFIKRAALDAATVGKYSSSHVVQFGFQETGIAYAGYPSKREDAAAAGLTKVRFAAGAERFATTGSN
jgi:hypothetical protein